jgi:biotin carboxyl carrier protein
MSATNKDGLVPIQASVTSIFYRRPKPGEPPFVEEGDKVNEDTTVCLLEIMKCFRSVAAGVNGTIEKVVADNAAMVNAGDTLMLIRPDK